MHSYTAIPLHALAANSRLALVIPRRDATYKTLAVLSLDVPAIAIAAGNALKRRAPKVAAVVLEGGSNAAPEVIDGCVAASPWEKVRDAVEALGLPAGTLLDVEERGPYEVKRAHPVT